MSLEAVEPARALRKQAAAIKSARKMLPLVSSYFADDFDDDSGIDGEASSNYEIDGERVHVADGQSSAIVVSVAFNSPSTIATVELVAARTPSDSLTFDVSADDGETWLTDIALETPISFPTANRGKALRLRANLVQGESLEYWSAHL